MTNIDQFESLFNSAVKTPFSPERITVSNVLVITDLAGKEASEFESATRSMLESLGIDSLRVMGRDATSDVSSMIDRIRDASCDLICTYRNLHHAAPDYPYSLGVHLDVMSQALPTPVLVLPHPKSTFNDDSKRDGFRSVMAITDHLTGDHHLVSYAARFTRPDGTLWLGHVEDQAVWQRYRDAISRIAEIDTDTAERTIPSQLLKESRDYVQSCRDVLAKQGIGIEVQMIVEFGHRLKDFNRMIQEHRVDLLVMNTKDEDQQAMHGLAYPLTVELRRTPMLLL